ncbi:MAG: L-threonylcarbamoyladenylate synthase [Isosphaeraceae bacterium]
MISAVRPVDPDSPDPAILEEAGARIRAGELVAFAAETVYGLGADATNPEAVARIYAAKGRPPTNPLIVHVADVEGARGCTSQWPEAAERLSKLWPGPLTLVLPRSAKIAPAVSAGRETVGVRIPASAVALGLIRHAGRPIAAPSANRSNRISPTRAEHIGKDTELASKIAIILDSGPTPAGIESTVVDLSQGPPYRVLRPGPLTAEFLASETGLPIESASTDAIGISPGQLPIHYAPNTPTAWVERRELSRFPWPERAALVLLGPFEPWSLGVGLPPIYPLTDPKIAEPALFELLHRLDDAGLDLIAIGPPPDEPAWRAVRDRIRRATGRR